MPCMSTSAFERVLAAWVIDPCHASITGGVTDSNAIPPKCGSNSERTIERKPATVDGLRPRSCSTYRNHSSASRFVK
jgi:hypothetical protein